MLLKATYSYLKLPEINKSYQKLWKLIADYKMLPNSYMKLPKVIESCQKLPKNN